MMRRKCRHVRRCYLWRSRQANGGNKEGKFGHIFDFDGTKIKTGCFCSTAKIKHSWIWSRTGNSYFYLEALIRTVRLHTKCWFRPVLRSVRRLIEIKSGNLRNHGQEWQVPDMDCCCSHWFYWKDVCGLRANTIHYQAWDFTIMRNLNLKKNDDDKGKYGPQWFWSGWN